MMHVTRFIENSVSYKPYLRVGRSPELANFRRRFHGRFFACPLKRQYKIGSHVRVTVTFDWTLLSRFAAPDLNLALQCAPPWQDGAFGVDGLPTSLVGSNWLSELAAVRRAQKANWIPREVPQPFDPQVRLLSVSAGTSLQGAARNPRANAGCHSIPIGQEPRSGASWHLASCHSTRISDPSSHL